MALELLDWAQLGKPKRWRIKEIAHSIHHPYGGGYAASRSASDKIQKAFYHYYDKMTSAGWLYLVEFWRARGGSAEAFFYEFPLGLYGTPGYGGLNIGEPADGFDTDVDVGFGGGATFTCKFMGDELDQFGDGRRPGRYGVEFWIREVA